MQTKIEREILALLEEAEKSEKYPLRLDEGRGFDFIIIFALAKKFATPFRKMQAYKLGIIDDKGNILRAPATYKEKNAFTPLDNIVLRIKRLIPKNLWYLLTFAYIFKGFTDQRSYRSMYESCETEEQMFEAEEKRLSLMRARKEVQEIINNNPKFTKEEFWSYIAECKDI